ncbi:MAG: hypothetical protein GC172_12220 [Phycisphaera sp.]|nr:hypothetical protein [Phycisphaera sp.]
MHTEPDRPTHAPEKPRTPRRGMAMVLALIAVGTAVVLGAALAGRRDDSAAVGDTLVRASAARAAAAGGLDVAMAILAEPSLLGGQTADGKTRMLFQSVEIGAASYSAEVLDLRTELPATADSEAVAVISRVDLGDISQSARAVGRLIRPDRRQRADLDLSEFAIFTTDGTPNAIRVHDNSRVSVWPKSPYAALREPLFVGDLSKSDTVDTDPNSVMQGWVRVRPGAPPRTKEEKDSEIADKQRSVPGLIHIPAPPLPFKPTYGPTPPPPPKGSITDTYLHGAPLTMSGEIAVGLPAGDGILIDIDGTLTIEGVLRILEPTVLIVRGDLNALPGTRIEVEGEATLAIIVFGTTSLEGTYVGDYRGEVPPRDGTADYGRGATCVQLFASGAQPVYVANDLATNAPSVFMGEIYAPLSGVQIRHSAVYGRVLGLKVGLVDAGIFYDPVLNSGRGWLNPDGGMWTTTDTVKGDLPSLLARFESKGFANVVELMSLDVDLPPMFAVTGANAATADEMVHPTLRAAIKARKDAVRSTHLGGGYAAEVVTDPKVMLDEFTGKEHLRPQ